MLSWLALSDSLSDSSLLSLASLSLEEESDEPKEGVALSITKYIYKYFYLFSFWELTFWEEVEEVLQAYEQTSFQIHPEITN